MKINWGHGITIAILAFMAFIIYIVFQTFQLNADLVQDDFYEQEVLFDEKKKMKHNYKNLSTKIIVEQSPIGILIKFPKRLNNIDGAIQFYRRDNKKLDKTFEIKLSADHIQTISYSHFIIGKYDISINFTGNDTSYLHQSEILF